MPRPDNIVPGDIIVREFFGNYLIWRVQGHKGSSLASRHERLGESDDQDRAISTACALVGSEHAVWFCDKNEKYRQIS